MEAPRCQRNGTRRLEHESRVTRRSGDRPCDLRLGDEDDAIEQLSQMAERERADGHRPEPVSAGPPDCLGRPRNDVTCRQGRMGVGRDLRFGPDHDGVRPQSLDGRRDAR